MLVGDTREIFSRPGTLESGQTDRMQELFGR